MKSLENKIVVVTGGTGNVGSFIVKELLKFGAVVAVPSRSSEKIEELSAHISEGLTKEQISRFKPFIVDIGNEAGAAEFVKKITDSVGVPNAVIASLGRFIPAPSVLNTEVRDLQKVIDGYLKGHFVVARAFLSKLKERGGTYLFINGPLALEPWEGSGAGLVSIATAGQQMLFRVLAQELKDSPVRINELITHAYIRNRETQPGSPIPGEAVGAYASYLVSDEAKAEHGQTVQLRSIDQLHKVGLEV